MSIRYPSEEKVKPMYSYNDLENRLDLMLLDELKKDHQKLGKFTRNNAKVIPNSNENIFTEKDFDDQLQY